MKEILNVIEQFLVTKMLQDTGFILQDVCVSPLQPESCNLQYNRTPLLTKIY